MLGILPVVPLVLDVLNQSRKLVRPLDPYPHSVGWGVTFEPFVRPDEVMVDFEPLFSEVLAKT